MNARFILATAILCQAGVAAADDTAGSALERANKALKAGRIHEACTAFEASDKLEPAVDTELSLASCYEEDGKPMAAARLYRSVADKDTNPARRQRSVAKAGKLEANAPKLRFAINPMPKGLVIKVDGVEVPATGDVLVDQGPHEVIATAPGYEGHASAPVDRDRVVIDVIIRMEPVAQPEAAKPMIAPAEAAPAPTESMRAEPAVPMAEQPLTDMPADHRRRNGIIIGAGGVALLAGAIVLFELSANKFDDEHALCPMSRCANDDDLAKAKSLLSDGRTLRATSIGMSIGSGALLIAGAYLLLTPTKHEPRVSLQMQPGGASIGYTAHF